MTESALSAPLEVVFHGDSLKGEEVWRRGALRAKAGCSGLQFQGPFLLLFVIFSYEKHDFLTYVFLHTLQWFSLFLNLKREVILDQKGGRKLPQNEGEKHKNHSE